MFAKFSFPFARNGMRGGATPALIALAIMLIPRVAGQDAPAGPAQQGQSAAAPADDLQIRVSEALAPAQLITVPVNQGVLVDFSLPLKEVRVANPAIAEAAVTSPRQLLLSGKSFGTTQLVVWVNGGSQRVFNIAVDLDLERLQASIRAAVPQADVKVKALLNSVVISGNVPDATDAERVMQIARIYTESVVNHMKVAGSNQVMLHCTVAEVNRSVIRQLGFNGWMAGENFQDMFFVDNLDGINPSNIGAAGNVNVMGSVPFLTGMDGIPITGNTTLSFGFPRAQMQIFVQALKENGLLTVLAEPNLVAISGQEATFLAGGEFPIPVPQGGTNNAITIDFKQFGVYLKFTPAVLGEGRIRLSVNPEVSEPDYSQAITLTGYVVPGLVQRSVNTVVELGSGQTFAIGGLLSERTRASARKVPGLGDIPVLGQLFSSVRYQTNESEMIVLVTPEIVAPISPDQVNYVPGDDRKAPNDFEFYVLGQQDALNPGTPRRYGAPNNTASPARSSDLYGPKTSLRLRGPVGPAGNQEGS